MARVTKLADGIWRVPTVGKNAINSFAIQDSDGSIVLIDAGLKGAKPKLVAGLKEIGKTPSDVKMILATHAHGDHVGAAQKMHDIGAGPLHAHEDDASFIREGKMPPWDQSQMLARIFKFAVKKIPASSVGGTFVDNEVIDVAGGIRVVHTPGHSPGHSSFLLEKSGILITGDALFNLFDRISYSFALACSNYKMSRETALRLGDADYEIAAFTHGGEITENARDTVRKFLKMRSDG